MTLDADLAFAGPAGSFVGEAWPLVTEGADLTPEALAGLIRAAYFCPSDAPDADAWASQSRRTDAEARRLAWTVLASEDEARRRAIADTVACELLWLLPTDRQVHHGSQRTGRGRLRPRARLTFLCRLPAAAPRPPASLPPGAGERRAVGGDAKARGSACRPRVLTPCPPSLTEGDTPTKIVTAGLRKRLLGNGARLGTDHVPVLKIFHPCGAATWLFTEMIPNDPDWLFGPCDTGQGYPELGMPASTSARNLLGLGVERDRHFRARHALSVYAQRRRAGRTQAWCARQMAQSHAGRLKWRTPTATLPIRSARLKMGRNRPVSPFSR